MAGSPVATTTDAVRACAYDDAEMERQLAMARRLDAACPHAVFHSEEGRDKAIRLLDAGYNPEAMMGDTWTEGRTLAVTRDWEFAPYSPPPPDTSVLFVFHTHYPFAGESWGLAVDDELDFSVLDSHGLGQCSPVDAWEWFGPDGLNTVVYRAPDFAPPAIADRIAFYLDKGWDASDLLAREAGAVR